MKYFALLACVLLSGAVAAPAADLAKASKEDLCQQLWSGNSWQRRQAQRLLSENLTAGDKQAVEILAALAGPKARTMKPAPTVETRMAALGVLQASGTLTEKMLVAITPINPSGLVSNWCSAAFIAKLSFDATLASLK